MTTSQTKKITEITIGARHRKDMGDLDQLADSILEEGLLQPIGITPEGELVFGHRRLAACRDILKWDEIDVRIVEISSIAAGEMHENEMRKAFTETERYAIFETLRVKGAGRPRDNSHRGANYSKEHETKDWRADKAAQDAGFAGRGTAYRVKDVIEMGVPELAEAMDAGKITVSAAAKLSRLPKEEQREALKAPKPKAPRQPKVKGPPQKPVGQILLDRAKRTPAFDEQLSLEDRGYPPPELAAKQHPDYPAGVTYAMAWREENGRVQLWSQATKKQMAIAEKFRTALAPVLQLDPGELDQLTAEQRSTVVAYLRRLMVMFGAYVAEAEIDHSLKLLDGPAATDKAH